MTSPTTFHPSTPATWAALSHAQRLSAVAALVSTGSARDAAIALATTTNTIIGFCSRNDIELGNWTPVTRKTRPVEFEDEPASGLDVSLVDRQENQCCWPTTGSGAKQMFCGRPIRRGSYCKAHGRRAYAPRAADQSYTEVLRLGRILAGKQPEVSIEQALLVVRPKPKMRGIE